MTQTAHGAADKDDRQDAAMAAPSTTAHAAISSAATSSTALLLGSDAAKGIVPNWLPALTEVKRRVLLNFAFNGVYGLAAGCGAALILSRVGGISGIRARWPIFFSVGVSMGMAYADGRHAICESHERFRSTLESALVRQYSDAGDASGKT